MHGSTFGGNALACAVGRATIEYMEKENLVQRAEEMGAYFMERLRMIDSDKIREVRGMGLIIAVELKKKAVPYLKKLQEEHRIILLNAGPTVIRIDDIQCKGVL